MRGERDAQVARAKKYSLTSPGHNLRLLRRKAERHSLSSGGGPWQKPGPPISSPPLRCPTAKRRGRSPRRPNSALEHGTSGGSHSPIEVDQTSDVRAGKTGFATHPRLARGLIDLVALCRRKQDWTTFTKCTITTCCSTAAQLPERRWRDESAHTSSGTRQCEATDGRPYRDRQLRDCPFRARSLAKKTPWISVYNRSCFWS
jgi:hypothetical protein